MFSALYLPFSTFCLAASSLSFSYIPSQLSIFLFPLVLFVSFPLVLLIFMHIRRLLYSGTCCTFPVPETLLCLTGTNWIKYLDMYLSSPLCSGIGTADVNLKASEKEL